ncbi:MAG TPA: hypothetical protein VFN74_22295 [Chloroflexota bacterium]|nr:hypothetical protein [Chloroflexota bacterium]
MPAEAHEWTPFYAEVPSMRGSEGGVIIADEEYDGAARITLESGANTAPFAITCGVYGWMVHTRFFADERSARRAFVDMKMELARIVDRLPDGADLHDSHIRDVSAAISSFVERFP